jgi:hypothetical protein
MYASYPVSNGFYVTSHICNSFIHTKPEKREQRNENPKENKKLKLK